MTDGIVEPLAETRRLRTRDIKYWGGSWESVAALIPQFELADFRIDEVSPSNPYMKMVVRRPMTRVERAIPVGVVSNSYGLAQHHEVATRCLQGIEDVGVDSTELRCEVGLTELGEWMNLRVYFPQEYDFKRSDQDDLGLRLECFNSVDGSSRLVIVFGWLRFVCANGMIIGETKTEIREIHDARIDLEAIRPAIAASMAEVQRDRERMTLWIQTRVDLDEFGNWVNGRLAQSWGKKAAARVFHVCMSGHDVELETSFAGEPATDKPVRPLERVPGSLVPATTLFDVGQAMSWVATGRNNPDERLAWQAAIAPLIAELGEMAGSC